MGSSLKFFVVRKNPVLRKYQLFTKGVQCLQKQKVIVSRLLSSFFAGVSPPMRAANVAALLEPLKGRMRFMSVSVVRRLPDSSFLVSVMRSMCNLISRLFACMNQHIRQPTQQRYQI